MDKAREAPAGKGAGTAQGEETPAAPWSLGVPRPDRIPGDTDGDHDGDLKEDVTAEDEPQGQDRSDLAAVGRDKKRKRDASRRKAKKQKVDVVESQKMQCLLSAFSEEQLDRYEVYRRSAFPLAALQRLMQPITRSWVPKNVLIAMAGISKVFVGEVVEAALDVCEQWGETPPLQPKHLREAVRRLSSKGQIPNSKHKKIFFF